MRVCEGGEWKLEVSQVCQQIALCVHVGISIWHKNPTTRDVDRKSAHSQCVYFDAIFPSEAIM